jgi:hypothetical protein
MGMSLVSRSSEWVSFHQMLKRVLQACDRVAFIPLFFHYHNTDITSGLSYATRIKQLRVFILKMMQDAVNMTTTVPDEPPTKLQTLQAQMDSLNALATQMSSIRGMPSSLLRGSQSTTVDGRTTGNAMRDTSKVLGEQVTELRDFLGTVVKPVSQTALDSAGESYKADKKDVNIHQSPFTSKRMYV